MHMYIYTKSHAWPLWDSHYMQLCTKCRYQWMESVYRAVYLCTLSTRSWNVLASGGSAGPWSPWTRLTAWLPLLVMWYPIVSSVPHAKMLWVWIDRVESLHEWSCIQTVKMEAFSLLPIQERSTLCAKIQQTIQRKPTTWVFNLELEQWLVEWEWEQKGCFTHSCFAECTFPQLCMPNTKWWNLECDLHTWTQCSYVICTTHNCSFTHAYIHDGCSSSTSMYGFPLEDTAYPSNWTGHAEWLVTT